MKKISTPFGSAAPTRHEGMRRKSSPSRATIEFLRQFARSYQAVAGEMSATLPGFSLN